MQSLRIDEDCGLRECNSSFCMLCSPSALTKIVVYTNVKNEKNRNDKKMSMHENLQKKELKKRNQPS